jgi:Arc/MetJ-type ribon-helix-helix transcriptional regulator
MSRRSPRLEIRINEKFHTEIRHHAKAHRYESASAFVRAAIEQAMGDREKNDLIGVEERLIATIVQVRRELFRLRRPQQALLAFVGSLAKVLLTCMPEPPGAVWEAAIALEKDRHPRLLKAAGTSMAGYSQGAMRDLVERGEE